MRIVILANSGRELKEYSLEVIKKLLVKYGRDEGVDETKIVRIYNKSIKWFKNETRRLG